MVKKRELRGNREYYFMILPAALILFIFAYLPMPGVIIAFKLYNFKDGIFGSPFVGFKNFEFFFKSQYVWRTTFNTLWINFNNILWGTIITVTFAIMLNEIIQRFLKRAYQNLMFLPYFISAVVIGRFVNIIFDNDMGLLNQCFGIIGINPVDWYLHPEYWVKILVGTFIWKHTGYQVIIYLAVISGINGELYESSALDGATKLQRICYITLPILVPTIIILTLLSVGRIFFGDFQTIYATVGDNGALMPTTDIIETYVFRAVKTDAEFSMAGAVGLYQSIMGFVFVYGSNRLVGLYNKDYTLF